MKLLALDFETYFDKDVSLKKLNIMEYVNHPKFKVMGCAAQFIDMDNLEAEKLRIFMGINNADWYSEDEVQDFLDSIDWSDTAVLCHHTDFDAYILSQCYKAKPAFHYDSMAMSRGKWPGKSASLAALAERLFPTNNKIRKGTELSSAKGIDTYGPELDEIIGNYAKNDVYVMLASFIEMLPTYPTQELQIIDIVCRMFTQPRFVLNRELTTGHRDKAKANSGAKITAAGVDREVLSSNTQFAAYVKDTLGLDVPYKPGKKGPIPALGKNDIAFQKLQAAHPEHKAIWDARLASKSRIDETRATRFLNGANRDGTISMPLKYYAAHCLPGEVEVLTSTGWQQLKDWSGGAIAQYNDETKTIEFLHADKHTGPIVNTWVSSTAPYMPVEMTEGHCVPYLQHGNFKPASMPAADLLNRGSAYIPNSGALTQSGSITPEQMRVLVAVQADGHWQLNTAHGRELRISLTKKRKQDRFRKLLKAASVTFEEQTFNSHPDEIRFTVRWATLPAWLTPERKFFGSWLLDSTSEARRAFVTEIPLWDGSVAPQQIYYTSTVKDNILWAQTICHLTGYSASWQMSQDPRPNRQPCYKMTIRNRAYCMVQQKHMTTVYKPQQAFCAKTQTGFWLARSNDQIFITGNTGRFGGGEKMNPQNLKRGSDLRKALCAPEGYMVVVADKSQIEARLTAWMAGCDKLLDAFRNKRDVYSEFATSIYKRLITKEDKIERFVGKTCVAKGTPILTERGLVPIEQIQIDDRVWDGIEWVNHKGVVYQGFKDVITYQGLTATPDHGVFTTNGPIPFGQAAQELADLTRTGVAEQAIRISESNLAGYNSPGSEAEHLRVRTMYELWKQEMDQSRKSSSWINQRLSKLFTNQISAFQNTWKTLRRNCLSLQQSLQSKLQALWCPRDQMQIQLTNGVHPVGSQAFAPSDIQQSRNRSDQQRRTLRTGESTPSYSSNADSKPKMFKEHVYDIIDAGPRKRYTAANTLILNCILGLGFGVGGVKLQATLESGSQGPVVIITEIRAKEIVATYRYEFPEIPILWKKLESIFVWIQNPNYYGQSYGPMTAAKDGFVGPNGMVMNYPEAEGLSFYDARYKMRKKLWGGVLTENFIQFLARCDICNNMAKLDTWFKENPEIEGTVSLQIHDEIICICKSEYAQQVYDKMYEIMTTSPEWAPDLPLACEGGFAQEYSK